MQRKILIGNLDLQVSHILIIYYLNYKLTRVYFIARSVSFRLVKVSVVSWLWNLDLQTSHILIKYHLKCKLARVYFIVRFTSFRLIQVSAVSWLGNLDLQTSHMLIEYYLKCKLTRARFIVRSISFRLVKVWIVVSFRKHFYIERSCLRIFIFKFLIYRLNIIWNVSLRGFIL